jgi:hypothetical protein
MKVRSISILFLCAVVISACVSKQTVTSEPLVLEELKQFPIDWIGKYEGPLRITSANGDTSTINMELIIDYPDAEGYFPWVIIYDDSDIRKYGLEVINADKGLYKINEYNSIVLDAYLIENHFISRFNLLNNDLIIDYEHVGDAIIAQFYISGKTNVNTTGGEVIGDDAIPEVNTYPILVYQKAILRKKE